MLKNDDKREIPVHYATGQSRDVGGGYSTVSSASAVSQGNYFIELTKHRFFAPLVYISLGLVVFFCFFIIFNTYVLHLKVETAVVSVPIETMMSPMNGYISKVYVLPGKTVKKGAALFKIENIELERQLQLARVQFAESALNIEYYKHLLINEHQRLKVYQKIGNNRVISAQTQVNKSQQNVLMLQHNVDRLDQLHKKNYISEAILEAEQVKFTAAQEQLTDAKAQQSIEEHSLHAVNKGMYFTGTKTEGIGHDLDAELEAAQKRSHLDQDRVKIYENLIKKLTVVAPFNAKVMQILKSAGNTTDQVTPIMLIQRLKTDKHIIAYLTQEEIIHIGGDRVKIYIPSLSYTYAGKIMEINRTDGFIDAVKAQYQWRDFQIDRSAMVTIEILPNDQERFDKIAFPGMPTIVYFKKKY